MLFSLSLTEKAKKFSCIYFWVERVQILLKGKAVSTLLDMALSRFEPMRLKPENKYSFLFTAPQRLWCYSTMGKNMYSNSWISWVWIYSEPYPEEHRMVSASVESEVSLHASFFFFTFITHKFISISITYTHIFNVPNLSAAMDLLLRWFCGHLVEFSLWRSHAPGHCYRGTVIIHIWSTQITENTWDFRFHQVFYQSFASNSQSSHNVKCFFEQVLTHTNLKLMTSTVAENEHWCELQVLVLIRIVQGSLLVDNDSTEAR